MAATDLPYPFADLTLARRLERAEGHASRSFIEARATTDPARGAAWTEIAGAHVLFDGPDSPITQTFGLGLSGPVTAAALDAIEAFLESRGGQVAHEVCPMADAGLIELLNARRYEPFEFTSVMYRPLAAPAAVPPALPPGVTIRLAAAAEHEGWARTAAAGWGDQAGSGELVLGFGRIIAASGDGAPFLAELDGRPVATGALVVHEGVGLLAGASTMPAARRRGLQAALLAARLHHAADRGCDIAMMGAQAGSSSQRNAERNAFRIAYTRTKWRKPRPAG